MLTKVILTAMKEEADIVINNFWLKEIKSFNNFKIYEGIINNNNNEQKIILALAWIWKIQAAIATTYLFENYTFDKFINIWIAWNLAWSKYNIWDVFLIDTIYQHDMYLPFEWEHLNYAKKEITINNELNHDFSIFNFNVFPNGKCLTWDQFIDNKEKINLLNEKYIADVCEMEAFAVFSVAREYNFLNKCIAIKSISDWANNKAKNEHMNNLDYAMENSVKILKLIL